MKNIIQILICLSFIRAEASPLVPIKSTAEITNSKAVKTLMYDDGKLNIQIQHFKEANLLNHDWLSILFHNTSTDSIIIDRFDYSMEYDTIVLDSKIGRRSMGSGNKFFLFPFYTDLEYGSNDKMVLQPNEKVKCYRYISNYAAVLLGYENPTDLKIHAEIRASCKFETQDVKFEFENELTQFNFVWTPTHNRNQDLAERLIKSCDSINYKGHSWIVTDLTRDTNITSIISEDNYVRLITQKQKQGRSKRSIIGSFLKHYGHNDKINAFYISELPTADWSILEQLDYYWHDSFLDPLVRSYRINNDNHFMYLSLLDKHHELWQNDKKLKSSLFKQYKAYVSQGFIESENLTPSNIHQWQNWLKGFSQTHSKEAEDYFKTFFDNETPLFHEIRRSRTWGSALKYYPTYRVCDAAVEAYIYSEFGDVLEVYKKKFEDLVQEGILQMNDSNSRQAQYHSDLLDKENMQIIRNALIKDFSN